MFSIQGPLYLFTYTNHSRMTYHGDDNILIPPSLQLFNPRLRPCKRIRIGNIVHDNSCSCASIIHWSQRAVSLLTGCVPNLKFYSRVIESNTLCQECGCTIRNSYICKKWECKLLIIKQTNSSRQIMNIYTCNVHERRHRFEIVHNSLLIGA